MRSVVVDYARRRGAKKRGGAARRVDLDEGVLRVEQDAAEILAIHEALDRLAALDERLGDLVELRFFGGLSVEETADRAGRLRPHGEARLDQGAHAALPAAARGRQ